MAHMTISNLGSDRISNRSQEIYYQQAANWTTLLAPTKKITCRFFNYPPLLTRPAGLSILSDISIDESPTLSGFLYRITPARTRISASTLWIKQQPIELYSPLLSPLDEKWWVKQIRTSKSRFSATIFLPLNHSHQILKAGSSLIRNGER